jgi:hypothetical protein
LGIGPVMNIAIHPRVVPQNPTHAMLIRPHTSQQRTQTHRCDRRKYSLATLADLTMRQQVRQGRQIARIQLPTNRFGHPTIRCRGLCVNGSLPSPVATTAA